MPTGEFKKMDPNALFKDMLMTSYASSLNMIDLRSENKLQENFSKIRMA